MKTEKEKMQAGETYYAFDPELMELHRDCLKWVEEYNRTYFRDYTQGGELLRKFLPNAHPSLVIQAPFWCDFGFNIYGGENGFINYNCTDLFGEKYTDRPECTIVCSDAPDRLSGTRNRSRTWRAHYNRR